MIQSGPARTPFLLLLGLLLAASPSGLVAAGAPSKAKVHGVAVSGTISRLDPAKMTLSVREATGREVALSWTHATKITGTPFQVGEVVTLRYFDKDSKHIAATIHVGVTPATTPATTSAAAPAPAPKT